MDLVILAAGAGKRFGGKKLLVDIKGHKLYEHMYNIYEKAYKFNNRLIVSGDTEILDFYKTKGFTIVYNGEPELGKSRSITLAIKRLESFGDSMSVMFGVCDQPLLRWETVRILIEHFNRSDKSIAVLRFNDKTGNPCIFSNRWYRELINLRGDCGGKKIIKNNLQEVMFQDVDEEEELLDIDTRETYNRILRKIR